MLKKKSLQNNENNSTHFTTSLMVSVAEKLGKGSAGMFWLGISYLIAARQ
jgi:hypothetical protein